MLRKIKLYGTTASDGSLVVVSDVPVLGSLHSVCWIDGTFADGVDATLTIAAQDNVPALTLLTLTNANNDAVYQPRFPASDNAGATVTYDGTNEIYVKGYIDGYLTLTVASGGDTKSGGMIVYYEA